MMATKRKATKHALAALDREVAALRLRKAGCTYDVIARRLGYANRSGAWHAVRAGLTATLQEPADELRQLELERLDRMHEALWSKAVTGHLRSVDRVLAISKRRAALLGLDAPREIDCHPEVTARERAERMAARYGVEVAAVLAEAESIVRQITRRSDGCHAPTSRALHKTLRKPKTRGLS
jgi:hypothetical protein